jgi:hypothetical protein
MQLTIQNSTHNKQFVFNGLVFQSWKMIPKSVVKSLVNMRFGSEAAKDVRFFNVDVSSAGLMTG